MAVTGNGLHLLHADVAGPHEGVAVLAAAAGDCTVVVMDQSKKGRVGCLDFFDVAERVLAADKGVTGVQADAEALVCEALDKGDEFIRIREHLRALARRSLK